MGPLLHRRNEVLSLECLANSNGQVSVGVLKRQRLSGQRSNPTVRPWNQKPYSRRLVIVSYSHFLRPIAHPNVSHDVVKPPLYRSELRPHLQPNANSQQGGTKQDTC